LVALFALVAVANALVYEPKVGLTLEGQFDEYSKFWNKVHATPAERAQRFENFKMNAAKIAILNEQTRLSGKGAHFGFTKFSDWSLEEFRKLNGFRPAKPLTVPTFKGVVPAPSGPVDWVAKGMTTAVKDQGQCGSCWAFSTTETVESANLLAGRQVPNLSPQEIVDCDTSDQGCNGGDPQEALGWVQQQGGQDTDQCYPYTAEDGTCNSANSNLPSPSLASTLFPKTKTPSTLPFNPPLSPSVVMLSHGKTTIAEL
jgi:hypothetical protein